MELFKCTAFQSRNSFIIRNVLLIFGSCAFLLTTQVDGHLGAFVRVEGKPNLPQREIRPFPSEDPTSMLRLPGLTFGGAYGPQRKMYVRNMNDPSIASVYGISTSGGGSGYEDYDDKPAFAPYIGPRALTSVKAYLNHIRDNLEALHSEEFDNSVATEYEDDDEESETGEGESDGDDTIDPLLLHSSNDKHHSRREVRTTNYLPNTDLDTRKAILPYNWQPQQLLSDRSHGHNTRAFVDTPTYKSPQSFVLRRAVTSSYKPSWSYTNLGLGKRVN